MRLKFGEFAFEDRDDWGAERGGEEKHDAGYDQHTPRAGVGQVCESIDHPRADPIGLADPLNGVVCHTTPGTVSHIMSECN